MKLTEDSLRGRVVLSADGLAVGELERVFVDPAGWHVVSIEIKLRRDAAERLGVPRSLFHAATLEIPTSLVQSTGDAVILSVPVDMLRTPVPSQETAAPAPPL